MQVERASDSDESFNAALSLEVQVERASGRAVFGAAVAAIQTAAGARGLYIYIHLSICLYLSIYLSIY